MTTRKTYYVGQLQRPGAKPENVELILDERGNLTEAESAAGIKSVNPLYPPGHVLRYGYVADDSTDNTTALTNANAVATAAGGANLILPSGTGRYLSDVTITEGNGLIGQGYGTVLHGVAASLLIDANTAAEPVEWITFRDFSIKRTSTAGPAIKFRSIGTGNDYVANSVFDKIQVLESTGDGIHIDGCVGLTFIDLIVDSCVAAGLRLDGTSTDTSTVCNNVEFLRGNIIRNDIGCFMEQGQGVAFRGTVFEQNTSAGVDLARNCHRVLFSNVWFEANGNFDLRVGNDPASGNSQVITVMNCTFEDGSTAKDYAIELNIAHQVFIDSCGFTGYTVAAVNNDPTSLTAVDGHIGPHIWLVSTPENCDNETTYFYTATDSKGIFTATYTGWSDVTTDVLTYSVRGQVATLTFITTSGTSDTTGKSFTGLPAAIYPATTKSFPIRISNNGAAIVWGMVDITNAGAVNFYTTPAAGAWTASGTAQLFSTTVQWDILAS